MNSIMNSKINYSERMEVIRRLKKKQSKNDNQKQEEITILVKDKRLTMKMINTKMITRMRG